MPTKIQWTDESWQPVVGCTKVSLGCDNCYAERMANRLACMGQAKYERVIRYIINKEVPRGFSGKWNGKIYCDEKALEIPLHWRNPRKIFVCSMSDLFNAPFEFIAEVYKTIAFTEQHTYQILTKREKRMLEFHKWLENKYTYDGGALMFAGENSMKWQYKPWPLPNLWLGVTAENQEQADKRIPILLQIPAVVRFVSAEPLLENISFLMWNNESQCEIDQIIIGCESGPKRRECEIEWVRDIIEEQRYLDTSLFVKQLNINGKVSKDMSEWPEDLRIREYPKLKGISSADDRQGDSVKI